MRDTNKNKHAVPDVQQRLGTNIYMNTDIKRTLKLFGTFQTANPGFTISSDTKDWEPTMQGTKCGFTICRHVIRAELIAVTTNKERNTVVARWYIGDGRRRFSQEVRADGPIGLLLQSEMVKFQCPGLCLVQETWNQHPRRTFWLLVEFHKWMSPAQPSATSAVTVEGPVVVDVLFCGDSLFQGLHPGQIWQDTDPRRQDHQAVVERIGAEEVVCRNRRTGVMRRISRERLERTFALVKNEIVVCPSPFNQMSLTA